MLFFILLALIGVLVYQMGDEILLISANYIKESIIENDIHLALFVIVYLLNYSIKLILYILVTVFLIVEVNKTISKHNYLE